MEPEGVKRKLTTILAADVEGYSRLMSANEEATLRTLKSHRGIIDGLIGKHDGRVFGTAGDSIVAEFGSAVEAVRCAIAIQEELKVRNAELVKERQMLFRVGVNVGDVMIEDDNLYGDGVNVAARLEGLATAGGICISGSTFDQVKGKLSAGFEDIGPQEVKNRPDPVPAYRVVPGLVSTAAATAKRRWRMPALAGAVLAALVVAIALVWQPWVERVEAASVERMAYALPDKPSIAVLPFANMSGDVTDGALADGIAENITTALSRLPEMFVIAGTSASTYKNKSVTVRQVAEELGVRYVLEGSVQRSGEKVRVTAQLIDAIKGHHIWSERYDRGTGDAFALQDDITLQVLIALEMQLTEGERAGILRGKTNNLEAYQLLRQGVRLFFRFSKDGNAEAQRLFQKAVELDPKYAHAWYFLGFTHEVTGRRGWISDPAHEQALAEELVHKALAIDPSAGGAYSVLAVISLEKREFDKAIDYGEKAVAVEPNAAVFTAFLGRNMMYVGRAEEGLPLIERAIRLDPFAPPRFFRWHGQVLRALGRYEEAVAAFERARAGNPKSPLPLAHLAISYADMGEPERARDAAQAILDLNPRFSVKGFMNTLDHEDPATPERFLATLLELGLPE